MVGRITKGSKPKQTRETAVQRKNSFDKAASIEVKERRPKKVSEVLDTLPEETRKLVLKTMAKYGDNHWWDSDDPLEVAVHQVFEDTFLVDDSLFMKGLEKLLGRNVFSHEILFGMDALRKEAVHAIARKEAGFSLERTDDYKRQKFEEGILAVVEHVGEDKLINIDVSESWELSKKGDVCLAQSMRKTAAKTFGDMKSSKKKSLGQSNQKQKRNPPEKN